MVVLSARIWQGCMHLLFGFLVGDADVGLVGLMNLNWLVRPKCLYPAIIGIQLKMIPCIWLWRHLTSPQWFYKYLLMAGVWFWKNCLDWYPLETCPEVSKVIHRGFGIAVWSWSSLQVRPTDRKKIAIRWRHYNPQTWYEWWGEGCILHENLWVKNVLQNGILESFGEPPCQKG